MDTNPLVSVVIPVFKVEQYLVKCLDSVAAQSYRMLEVILVDDGSPDSCPAICDRYAASDSRFIVIHQENKGLSGARNIGIDRASGEYITFIDSDDYVEPQYVEVMLRNLLDHKCDISCVKHTVVSEKQNLEAWTGKSYVLTPEKALEMMLYHNDMDVSAWGKLYRRTLFDTIRFPEGRLFEDAATTYKLIDASERIFLDSRPLYNYVIRTTSITTESFSQKKLDLITSTKEMTDYVRIHYPGLEKACDRRLLYAYLSTLVQTLHSADTDKQTVKMLMSYIKDNRRSVMQDPQTPGRDKAALPCVGFGYTFFRLAWSLYSRLRVK